MKESEIEKHRFNIGLTYKGFLGAKIENKCLYVNATLSQQSYSTVKYKKICNLTYNENCFVKVTFRY